MSSSEVYTRVKAEDSHEYYCPLDVARGQDSLSSEQLDDCVEAEVVGRYIGHFKVVGSV